ncbi:helicase-exonuclease AddAB subunit AddA [Paenibacillus beijingensis]|uniref:ATP-dependent helicase/nuclease subunit A n=1 Tax=Paenibacillus beijingensis TaxID=1126833 RepID=A0A0D5NLW4_9BACL|nr:helicase-exonuclease AddAB subunit AddA [Paenibacillus beijingensis]AJY76319.1 ATP-dependent helicase [Paenibacillus beijingensis]
MNPVMPKPQGSTWTDDQWSAIVTEGSDVLVAAAAGSGKTAVLVERIIRKISADTDVDRLLVATFTKAAASEMKERIRIALEKALESAPSSEHLRRQLALLGRANITTLHSFCLDVIRRYYPLIGLDPGFRVANETESELMRIEVLDQLFEERYTEVRDGGAFLKLADRYGGEKGDDKLYHLTQQLYDFSRSQPWPDHWLRQTADDFRIPDDEELANSKWTQSLENDVKLALHGAAGSLREALALCKRPGGPDAYAVNLNEDLEAVEQLLVTVENDSWERWRDAFLSKGGFGRLKTMRGDDHDKELQEQVKTLREQAKQIVAGLAEELFVRSSADYLAEMRNLAPLMSALAELVIDFGVRYEEAKRAKGLLDFGDLEHFCLRILRDPASTPERTVPSAAALEYRNHFAEILLDEYQDTNRVQEAIVELIAGSSPGNRFMVGDVKQSIYRFRLAEPALFLHKYKSYETGDDAEGRPMEADGAEDGRNGTAWRTLDESAGTLNVPADTSDTGRTRQPGRRIDLARNFRSRDEVVDGVNDVFRALMRETVAEMDYDTRAELVRGAEYPPAPDAAKYAVELAVIDRGSEKASAEEGGTAAEEDEFAGHDAAAKEAAADMQTAQLEARFIARRIMELKESGFTVYDSRKHSVRPLAWRDIVILLRAQQQWSPVLIEELQQAGIPAYAELSTGYFEATEVNVMLSLLRIIDNPYQDIPLAGALRSPLFDVSAEELALIRIQAGSGAYFDAVVKAADSLFTDEATRGKLSHFLDRLERWREAARQGPVSDLIWSIYRETDYYDWVGGLVGGPQRQANLRALHDRARQYESTSLRGLFRFLRFIERMRESGGDLGTARAMGEGEDVVRIMSIHKSKGLEFPVVFVAGLGKMFNQQDVNASFLMHKDLGFGPKYVHEGLRVTYPTLPFLAVRRRMMQEMQAEELRVLYVALTRPKEKLILLGTTADAARQLQRWQSAADAVGRLPDYSIASARRFLDWLGPLALRSGMNLSLVDAGRGDIDPPPAAGGAEREAVLRNWLTRVVPSPSLGTEAAAGSESPEDDEEFRQRMQAVAELIPVPPENTDSEVERLLGWEYPFAAASFVAAKTSVTEMKRIYAETSMNTDAVFHGEGPFVERFAASESESAVGADRKAGAAGHKTPQREDFSGKTVPAASGPLPEGDGSYSYSFRLRRPRFMEEKSLTAAERGTVTHTVMQHVPLAGSLTLEALHQTVAELIERRILTEPQAEAADLEAVERFFTSDLGVRLLRADRVNREVPFSCTFPASRVYPLSEAAIGGEPILIQGVIDCLFEEGGKLVLLDYKTDRVYDGDWDKAGEKHRFQLELYAEAIRTIVGREVDECHLFFMNGPQAVRLR